MKSENDNKFIKEKIAEITERLLGLFMKRKIDRVPAIPLIGAASRHLLVLPIENMLKIQMWQ